MSNKASAGIYQRWVFRAFACVSAAALALAGMVYAEDVVEVRYFGRRPGDARAGITELGSGAAIGRIAVEFQQVHAREVADYIAEAGGLNVVLSDDIDEEVSIRFLSETPQNALKRLAIELGGSLRREAFNTYRIVKLPLVSLQFDDADVRTVIKQIAKLADGNVVINENVQGKVSLRVENVTWRAALDNVVRTSGFQIVEEAGGGILRIVTTDTLKEQRETRVFPLRYIQPPPTYRPTIKTDFAVGGPEDDDSIRAFSGTGGSVTRGNKTEFPLLKAVANVLSPVGKVEYDVFSNSLVATDIPPQLEKIAEVVRLVDTKPDQVFIDVKFVSTSNADLLDFGTDYQNVNGNPNLGFSVDISGGSFKTILPFNRGKGGFEDSLSIADDAPSEAYLAGIGSPYAFGNLRFNQFLMIMTFLKQDVNTVIMQAPKILTLDNSEATIFVGRTVRYAETFSSSNQAGGVEVGIREADQSPVDTGLQLLVVPHIVRGTDEILLELIPEDEALTGTGTTIPGFDDFKAGETSIQLPRISSRTIVTKLRLRSGYTAVLGGLVDERESETTRKIPFFGDIPLVGWAFKSQLLQKNKSNLLIFVTCIIVRNDQDIDRIYTVHRRYDAPSVSDVDHLFREEMFDSGDGSGGSADPLSTEDI